MTTDFIDYPNIPDSAIDEKLCITCNSAFFAHNKWMCDFPYPDEKYCKTHNKYFWKKRCRKLDPMFIPDFIEEEEMRL